MEPQTQDTSIPKFLLDDIPKPSSQDNLLTTAAITLIAGSVFLVGATPSNNLLVTTFLLISITTLSLSFFLLLWYNPRLGTRNEKWKKILENRLSKLNEEMRDFIHTYDKPLYKQEVIKRLEQHQKAPRNKKEWVAIVDAAFEGVRKKTAVISDNDIALKLFMKSFITDLYFMDKRIYRSPLKEESYSTLKYQLDMISWRFRYHFFTVGIITLVLAVVTHLLKI